MIRFLLKSGLIGSSIWGLFVILLICNSCSNSPKTLLEKTSNIDIGEVDDYVNTTASVSFKAADIVYLSNEEKLKAIVLFQNENDILAISFQITDENGKALIATINHIPQNFSLPLVATFSPTNEYDGTTPVASFTFIQAIEDFTTSPTPFEGSFKILKLTENEIIFEMDGKGGEAIDAENPAVWKHMTAKGVIKSPVIQTFGVEKKDVLK